MVLSEPSVPSPRRPGTTARVLLFLVAVAGFGALFDSGFPAGAPDRLPVLAIALAFAISCAQRPDGGLLVFAFLFPCSGLLARVFGGSDPPAWPVLLFAGVAVGWTFRFIYDFESRPEPSRTSGALRALVAVWTLAMLLAIVRARTLWALAHGLSGTIVNGDGLSDASAIPESVFAFAVLASGAGFFFILRRSGPAVRARALGLALAGVAAAGIAGGLERIGALPGRTQPFWLMTGRASGGATDPNSLGLLCGLALPAAIVLGSRGGTRPVRGLLAMLPFALGLLLSGSRSALLLVVGSSIVFVFARALPPRLRVLALVLGLALFSATAFLIVRGPAGTVGRRLAQTFDPDLPMQFRVSARPRLWNAAIRLFRRHPLEGAGLGSYLWTLPDLLREEGAPLDLRDNPGNTYLQALAESGILGLAATLLFAVLVARDGVRRLASPESPPESSAAALAVLPFFAVLGIGSHWAAADVGLFFFLLVSLIPAAAPIRRTSLAGVLRALVALYALAAAWGVLSTARAESAFRFSTRIGFHTPETAPGGGTFRWTHRNFAISVAAGGVSRVDLAAFTPEGRPVRLDAAVGRRAVFRKTLESGQAVHLRLANPTSGRVVFRFGLSHSFVPKHLGIPGEDRRELGVQAVLPGE